MFQPSELVYSSAVWVELREKYSIFHHLVPNFYILEIGPVLFSAYSCLAKWHSAVCVSVMQLCITAQLLKHKSFFPSGPLPDRPSPYHGNSPHLALISAESMWPARPRLQPGLGVGPSAFSAQAALPWYEDFGNDPIWELLLLIPPISSCSFTATPTLSPHCWNEPQGEGRETPIYNSSLPRGLVLA